MDTFDYLLNWTLKRGSHPFPGPDGGTCINEAALVAAGYTYKPVCFVEQMPNCFSRPICRLAMRLNDMADDEERQRLLPYVTRLACADTSEVEHKRAAFISHQTCGYFPASFNKGLEILDRALAMGRQADLLGLEEVQTRMDAARVLSKPPSPASKIKNWLFTGETEPTA